MISNPDCGWCDIRVGNFIGQGSYVTDIPLDFMECFIHYLHSGSGSVYVDEEGTEFTFVVSDCETYIIECRDEEPKLHFFEDIYPNELCKELVCDIESNFDGWVDFFAPDTDSEVENYRKLLNESLTKLKDLMKSRNIL